MTSVAVISAVYGDYDVPAPPPPFDADWILVTDRRHQVDGWRQQLEPRHHMHPRMAAKIPKCRPDYYSSADVTIWVDASFIIHDPSILETCVEAALAGGIAQIRHPDRQRITDEADVSTHMVKYQHQRVRDQVAHYLERGFPDGWGLWATGLIARRHRSSNDRTWMRHMGDSWLVEQMRWTYQDQLSQPYVLWSAGMKVLDIPSSLRQDPRFSIRSHANDN